jgi:hypothetical protein
VKERLKIEGTLKRGKRLQQPRDDIKEKKRYWTLKMEPKHRTVWRTRFGRGWGILPEKLLLAFNV